MSSASTPSHPDWSSTGFATRAIHAGQDPDATTGAVVPPIYQVSTYKQDGVGGLRGGYEYSRSANPTRTALEEALGAVETPAGAAQARGFAFASGLAAEDTLLRATLRPGDHVLVPDDWTVTRSDRGMTKSGERNDVLVARARDTVAG